MPFGVSNDIPSINGINLFQSASPPDFFSASTIATAAENDESAFEKAYNGLQGWVDCFEKASLKGMVGGGGIDAANTAEDHVDIMKKAYELGKNL